MKIGIIVLSRYSSSRLPGKALKLINGRSILGHILDRLEFVSNKVIVATSDQRSDDKIEKFCNYSNIECYRGSLENVSNRFLSCAEHYQLDYAVRINGDNIFTPWDILSQMLAITMTGNFQFITNVHNRTFPKGMSIEIIETQFFKEHFQKFNDYDKEHVTSFFYRNEDLGNYFNFYNHNISETQDLDLAIDTRKDYEFIKEVILKMDRYPATYTFNEIITFVINKDEFNPWKGKNGPLIIAEIGGNHEGDFEIARDLTRQAILTGVDFIKFQLYKGDTLVSKIESPDRNKHFKKFELSKEQHIELAKMCQEAGVGYMASIWDLDMLEWIDEFCPLYKIGSGDLTAWPIIEKLAQKGKPIILSSGLSSLDEILQTVSFLQRINKVYKSPNYLCILQCTSMYPIRFKDVGLNVMKTLKTATNLSVGYSDHTEGLKAIEIAVSMGAQVIEFHFTDSRDGKVFRDHKVSLTPSEVKDLQTRLKEIYNLQGEFSKVPQKIELDNDHVTSFRRGIYLNKDLNKGDEIKLEDLICLRPNHGIDARDFNLIVGSKTLKSIKKFTKIIIGRDI